MNLLGLWMRPGDLEQLSRMETVYQCFDVVVVDKSRQKMLGL